MCQIKAHYCKCIEDNNNEKELMLFWSYKWLPFKIHFFDKNHDTYDEDRGPGRNRPL